MGEVIDGRPAHIHAHVLRIEGDKILLPPRQRVVKPQTPEGVAHAKTLPWPAGRAVFLIGRKAKTSGPAVALADNADADNGDCRFHGEPYRAVMEQRQAECRWLAEALTNRAGKRFVNRPLIAFVGIYRNRIRTSGSGHDLDPNRRQVRSIMKPRHGDTKMQPTTRKKQAERPRPPALAGQYRAIGPAAITAALLCTPRQRNVKAPRSK
jgi:hypothetical protein